MKNIDPRSLALLAGLALAPLVLAGCATTPTKLVAGPTGVGDGDGLAINASSPLFPESLGKKPVHLPSLAEMQQISAGDNGALPRDSLRSAAIRDRAQAYGVQGGLAWGAREVNAQVKREADSLSRTYDFNQIVTHEGGGVLILPPVISSSRNTYEQSDFGQTLRVAQRTYRIIHLARFAPNAPLWVGYLLQHFTPPPRPMTGVLPKTAAERRLWASYVAQGWTMGLRQSREIFRRNLDKLNQDFVGMTRYAELLHAGKVVAPTVAMVNLGTTGSGQDMREGDRALKITEGARLAVPNTSVTHRITAPARLRRRPTKFRPERS